MSARPVGNVEVADFLVIRAGYQNRVPSMGNRERCADKNSVQVYSEHLVYEIRRDYERRKLRSDVGIGVNMSTLRWNKSRSSWAIARLGSPELSRCLGVLLGAQKAVRVAFAEEIFIQLSSRKGGNGPYMSTSPAHVKWKSFEEFGFHSNDKAPNTGAQNGSKDFDRIAERRTNKIQDPPLDRI